jgi:single stranded DNA-binding protein (ssb)
MSGTLNKVMLIGNLGKDPEYKALEGGSSLARFPIATSESYKNREGQSVTQTEWHNIVVFRGLAEIAEKYLKKGDKVFIEGRINTRSWKDDKGDLRYTTQILGDQLTMLGGNRSEASPKAEGQSHSGASTGPDLNSGPKEDDLPF